MSANVYHPSRGGVRGGKDQFNWDDVKSDKDRENYLGHSVKAPVGRWQKGKDLIWYTRDKSDQTSEDEKRKKEIQSVKDLEAQAMAAALGHKVPPTPVLKMEDKQKGSTEDATELGDGEEKKRKKRKKEKSKKKKKKEKRKYDSNGSEADESEANSKWKIKAKGHEDQYELKRSRYTDGDKYLERRTSEKRYRGEENEYRRRKRDKWRCEDGGRTFSDDDDVKRYRGEENEYRRRKRDKWRCEDGGRTFSDDDVRDGKKGREEKSNHRRSRDDRDHRQPKYDSQRNGHKQKDWD